MRKKKEFFTQDMTPLIDVVFLLLIFFLVTSVFKKDESALVLNLPKSEYSTQSVNSKDISILLTSNKIAYDGNITTLSKVDLKLATIRDKKILINIKIDKDVKYQRVVKVLDIMKKHSLTNLALVNEK